MTKRLTPVIQRCALILLGQAVAVAFAAGVARAAPLEPEACAALGAQRAELLSKGLEAEMSKGAAWARANLSQDRLLEIKRLIEVNEQLSFRCGIMVTERPTLYQRTPEPTQAMTAPAAGDEAPPQKKITKSKPKPATASVPAGLPGSKPKQPAKDTQTAPAKPLTEAKNTTGPKAAPPPEKSGN